MTLNLSLPCLTPRPPLHNCLSHLCQKTLKRILPLLYCQNWLEARSKALRLGLLWAIALLSFQACCWGAPLVLTQIVMSTAMLAVTKGSGLRALGAWA
ncbi:hypothetical protein [Leptolyngbya sp. FACHB-261]|uniref:hypothetical protein n=1 Tax=Leptolyngbya sp. FACHB-261 TaxID=2692806 RepID=UPI001685ADB0|nr:hypothetical protein [Leptolyngbya sp. FACHB-261]MBD2105182.1 hypothetical protein [Leptolyngbya sp. FACHB-261]